MTKVSFVVPCYNEQEGIPKLLEALEDARRALGPGYAWELVFVDDGSTDDTATLLERATPSGAETHVIRHGRNQGLGAAVRTGFARATGDLVATADSDCTYDPRELLQMVKLLTPGVDVVVASPYHPEGRVENVPAKRLVLSHNLSRIYGWVTGADLYTYTSLFRLYRAEVIRHVQFESNGFLSMVQILVEARRAGYRIVEYPTTLTVRRSGESKAKLFRMIGDHLQYVWQLLWRRWVGTESRRPH